MNHKKNSILSLGLKEIKLPYWAAAFLINMLIAMSVIGINMFLNGGYFVLPNDYSAEQIPFYIFMNDTIKNGSVLWNWGISLGSNFIESFSFYDIGSVFTWITWLFPADRMPYLMGWMLILKFGVAGLTSSIYIHQNTEKDAISIIASMLYAFSGFQLASIDFNHFQDVVALFPLLLIGIDKLISSIRAGKKKTGIFMLSCLVNLLCNPVFFVGEAIFLIIYYLLRYVIYDRSDLGIVQKIKITSYEIFSCCIEAILAALISGILLLPTVNYLLTNSDAAARVFGSEWLSMTTTSWLKLIRAFFLPAEAMNSTNSISTSDWSTNAAYLPVVGVVCVISFCRKEKNWLSSLIKLLVVMVIIPVLSSSFMLFTSTYYHRWYYMLVLMMVLASAKVLESGGEYDIRRGALYSIGAIAIFCLLVYVVEWDDRGSTLIYNSERLMFEIMAAIIGVIFLCIVIKQNRERLKNVLLFSVISICCILLLAFTVYSYQDYIDNTRIDFTQSRLSYGESVVRYLTKTANGLDRDTLPYRYCFDEGVSQNYYNRGLTNSLITTNFFNSTVNESIFEFYTLLTGETRNWSYIGYTGLQELLSVKYTIYTVLSDKIVGDENALPIGYCYDSYILQSEFENIEVSKRALVMLGTLVIEDEDEPAVSETLFHNDEILSFLPTDEDLDDLKSFRAEHCSEEFDMDDDAFSAVIETSSETYAFFSVPYDKYWKATVNGNEVDIIKINGLMAVPLSAGVNQIEFIYEYTPLTYGIICSATGLVLALIYILLHKKMSLNPSFAFPKKA